MTPTEPFTARAARWLAFGSAAAIMLSIAVSQILLGLAIVALLISRLPLRLPRIKWPLALFLLGTLISLAFSGEIVAGLPQVRKFYVFCELLVVYSSLRSLKMLRWLFLTWAGLGAITALRGFVQFADKVQKAHDLGQSVYAYYVGQRITGFTSHWNTYSAEEMFALVMAGAFLLFAPRARRAWLLAFCAFLEAMAVLLSDTRGVWLATFAAALYLIWSWRKKLIAVVPVVVLLIYLLGPAAIHERFTSILRPSGADSNQFRLVVWRTGLEMIQRHPFLGLGPEGVGKHFQEYVPVSIPRPLPTGWYGHLHNIYLHYAAERGIPTMLVLVWILVQMLVDFSKGLRELPPGRGLRRFLLHGAIAIVLAAMVEGCVELNLGDSEVLTMFLAATAAGYVALDKDVADA